MPIVTIQLSAENVTVDQKRAMAQEVTDTLHRIMQKDPERVYVIIEEVPVENWAAGGGLLFERRLAGHTGKCQCGAHGESAAASVSADRAGESGS